MPQPLVPDVTSWSPNPVWVRDHRPECVAAIGLVALAWTRVENELTSIVSSILGQSGRGKDGGWSLNPNWIVAATMREAETIRVRIKIVDAILKPILEGDELGPKWDALSSRLFKRSRDRNVVVHSEWAWSESAPEGLIQVQKDGRHYFWKEPDFVAVYKRINQVELDSHSFMAKVLNGIHERRLREFITPTMISD